MYVDDILVYSEPFVEHVNHNDQFLSRILCARIYGIKTRLIMVHFCLFTDWGLCMYKYQYSLFIRNS